MPGSPSLTVYLDSSDYSQLSNPRLSDDKLIEIRERLIEWSKSGTVDFVYSGIHISEMAPMDPAYSGSAGDRADLLVALCGKKTFVSLDRLLLAELNAVGKSPLEGQSIRNFDGNWFPKMPDDLISPASWLQQVDGINGTIRARGVNRHQRRALLRRYFKNGRPTGEGITALRGFSDSEQFAGFLSVYPMRPENAEVIWKYLLGIAAPHGAKDAFLNSLRDAGWMMRWFERHHDRLSPVVQWVRTPAQRMKDLAQSAADTMSNQARLEEAMGVPEERRVFTRKEWDKGRDDLVLSIANQVRGNLVPGAEEQMSADDLETFCPGFSCLLKTFVSSMASSFGEFARTPKDSDFVDALHAMYAPYVDIFRADSFMASFVQGACTSYGTTVVPKLTTLVGTIETEITRRKS